MDLYLIRHADAISLGTNGITDDVDRPLSDLGQTQVKALATVLQKQGVRLEALWTSPLVRARQTADLLVKHGSGQMPAVQTCEELAPGGKAKKLARFLHRAGGGSIGLVGHQPDLGMDVAWLIGSKKVHINLDKAGVAALHGDPDKGGATLIWLVTPDWYGLTAPTAAP